MKKFLAWAGILFVGVYSWCNRHCVGWLKQIHIINQRKGFIMKAVSAITIIGHEVAFEVNVGELTSSSYDETIEQVNDAILDGDESGTVDLGDDVFSWWIKNEKEEEIENLAFENKAMAEALKTLGFTQEQISQICSGGFMPVIINDERLKSYAVDIFTTDGKNGSQDYDNFLNGNKSSLSIWEPFENWPEEDIAEQMENTYLSLKQYFKPALVVCNEG